MNALNPVHGCAGSLNGAIPKRSPIARPCSAASSSAWAMSGWLGRSLRMLASMPEWAKIRVVGES
ncbi:hypothetical protein ACJ65_02090 [Kocuria rhizophila]|nr:hypothetical protein ACJ65_02090 [Kocuria rhizophila]